MDVYLLWHTHEMPDDAEDDDKFIGVYASPEDAELAKQRLLTQPGFRDWPDGFFIDQCTVGKERSWAQGFVTIRHEDLLREYGAANPE
jgi:hypothetical protein